MKFYCLHLKTGYYPWLLILCLMACNNGPSLNESDYIKWIEDPANHLNITSTTNHLKFVCQYLPSDYIISRELSNQVIDADQIKERFRKLENSLQFMLSITDKEGKSILEGNHLSKEETKQREDHLRFNTKKDLVLIKENGEVIAPSITQLIRNYGMKPQTEILIAFDRKDVGEAFQLELKNHLIDTVDIRFDYNINQIATLSTRTNL